MPNWSFRDWIEGPSILAIESQRQEEIMSNFDAQFSIYLTIFHTKIPIAGKPKVKLKEDRDIPKLKEELSEKVWERMKKAVDLIDPNWLDLGNYIIRKELEWDVNGILGQMMKDRLIVDYDTRCNNINNPPAVFQNHELVFDMLILWDYGENMNKISLKIKKHNEVDNESHNESSDGLGPSE